MRNMKNLKQETLEAMKENGKTIEDIAWIGCVQFSIPISLFFKLADTEYDDGWGKVEVAGDLQIVFNDNSVLFRKEYDGAEWWGFVDPNKPSSERDDIIALTERHVDEDARKFGYVDTSSIYSINFGDYFED